MATPPSKPARNSANEPTDWHARVSTHTHLVTGLVQAMTRHAPAHVDRDELHAAGLLGLVDAAKRFTSNGTVPFAAYATVRIRGAILDVMRRDDWAPRSVRTPLRQMKHAKETLQARLQREPTLTELAQQLGWSREHTSQMLAADQRTQLHSLAANTSGSYDTAQQPWQTPAPTPEEHTLANIQVAAVKDAITLLPPDLRQVLSLRFLHEWSLSQIGAVLHVTDARVAQLVKEAILIVRAVLADQQHDVPAVMPDTPGSVRRAQVVATASALRSSAPGRSHRYT